MSSLVPETSFAYGASGPDQIYNTTPTGLGLQPAYLASSSASSTATAQASGVVMSGEIGPSGGIGAGTGFSVTHNGTGDYSVNFTVPFTTAPMVTVTPISAFAVSALIGAPSTTGFRVNWRDPDAAGGIDVTWNFIAV